MNNIDKQYQSLLQDILDNGVEKQDRTGTGTLSVFGRQIRHKMSEGFPLLTTKKMYFKGIVTELLWFLRGDTNIKFLVDNGCHIWDGDAYKNYTKEVNEIIDGYMCGDILGTQPHIERMFSNPDKLIPLTKDEFIKKIKGEKGFAKRDFVDKWGELGPIYGKQWRRWTKFEVESVDHNEWYESESIDQIANLINDLKINPDSRRLIVNAWNVAELDQMVLPPCHYGFQVYTREFTLQERINYGVDKLGYNGLLDYGHSQNDDDKIIEFLNYYSVPKRTISLMWNQRSVDTFLGLPFNIASYGLLLEIIAKVVNMVSDELIGNLGDVHLYNNHIEQAREQVTRTPYELPSLNINTEFWQTESGECGIGPLSTDGFISALSNDAFIKCLLEEDIRTRSITRSNS
jgi:thymidylate synthase